jgi:hypothetical protein
MIPDCKPIEDDPEYSFETHGKGYALYLGRSDHSHGYNLANMTEIDRARLEQLIIEANLGRKILQQQIK